MKKSEVQELRKLPVEELEAQVSALREAMFKGRVARFGVAAEDTGTRQRQQRRQVARLLTIIKEKKAEVAS